MNEPNHQMTTNAWNQYLAEALAIIRASNPTRTVVIGPAFSNSIDHLDELRLPAKDRNLIVTVHYYKPMDFTPSRRAVGTQRRQGRRGVAGHTGSTPISRRTDARSGRGRLEGGEVDPVVNDLDPAGGKAPDLDQGPGDGLGRPPPRGPAARAGAG